MTGLPRRVQGSFPTRGEPVDTLARRTYSREMANSVSRIQIGQLWKKDGTGETFLVTRVYSEALTTLATLRKSGAESEALVRVKVERAHGGQTLPGFSPAQEDERI